MPKSNKNNKKIYLDYAASVYANPSSIHELGREANQKLEKARKVVADFLGARVEEIIFTSGNTESNNLAIQGTVLAWHRKNHSAKMPHLITTNIEHPSVLKTCKMLAERKLAEISVVKVEKNGIIDPRKLEKVMKRNTFLVSVMSANNEIGTIQPIREIAKVVRHYKKKNNLNEIYLHTDAVQAVDFLDLNVEKLGVDLLSFSGTKIKGAGGSGVLYKRKNVSLAPVFAGGEQEHGFRPGTENLGEILKLSSALSKIKKEQIKKNLSLKKLRIYFIQKLNTLPFRFIISGDLENRLPNNLNITFPKIPSDLLVLELSARGIMVSSKSACRSSEKEGSYVLKALHPEADKEIGGLRFSLGEKTTRKDIDYTVRALSEILTKLKKWYN